MGYINKENIKSLIKDYLSKVNIVLKILRNQARLNPQEGDEFRLGGISKSGSFKEQGIKLYEFHGIGCYVEHDNFTVEFNMDITTGKDNPIRGFNPYFVFEYLESIQKTNDKEWKDFDNLLEKLIKEERISAPYTLNEHSGLCYLREDYEYLIEHKPWEQNLNEDSNPKPE